MGYSGYTVPIPVGLYGLHGSINELQMNAGHLIKSNSFVMEGRILQKEGGATKLNSTTMTDAVEGGINWSPDSSVEYDVVFLDGGTVKRDTSGAGTFATTLVSGLQSVDPSQVPPVFTVGGGESAGADNKLFMFTHSNQVHVVAGTSGTMAAISDPASDWSSTFPTFGLQHDGRLWAGGHADDPHRIYYSQPGDHENFTGSGSGSISIYPGEGLRLAGGISFRGLLILFKYPRGIYVVHTQDATPANWSISRISEAVGTINQHTIVSIDNEVIYMDQAGMLHALSATDVAGDVNTGNISLQVDWHTYVRQNINLVFIHKTQGAWYPGKQQIWFTIPALSSAVNNRRIIVDFSDPQIKPRFYPSDRDSFASLWVRPDILGLPIPAGGDYSGFVWQLDRDARHKDGAAYEARLETSNTDLGFVDQKLATVNKSGQFLELVSEPQGDWDLTVEVWWDDILTNTVLYNMGVEGAPLDSFVLDTDKLASGAINSRRRRIGGYGRRIRLVIYNQGIDQNVAMSSFFLGFKVNEESTRDD